MKIFDFLVKLELNITPKLAKIGKKGRNRKKRIDGMNRKLQFQKK